jgi:hypothetical protein
MDLVATSTAIGFFLIAGILVTTYFRARNEKYVQLRDLGGVHPGGHRHLQLQRDIDIKGSSKYVGHRYERQRQRYSRGSRNPLGGGLGF